jgi:lipopolysaccharide transport system permease protein
MKGAQQQTSINGATGTVRGPFTSNGTETVVIRPSKGLVSLNLRDLWKYRELLYFMVWRDIKVRYKQTALGALWALVQPFLTMVVFSVFFGQLARMPSDGIPYPLFAYTALLPWQLFSRALTDSSSSIVTNSNLVTKVYFPRLVFPIAAVVAGLVDFAIAFVLLLGLMFFYGVAPGLAILTLPLFLALAVASALAVGLWLSALNVQYRDVRHTVPFLTQLWMFATPIAYSSSLVPARWRVWYGLNPMAGVVEGFRWALLGQSAEVEPMIVVSTLVVGILLIGGLIYFRQMEKTFADVV